MLPVDSGNERGCCASCGYLVMRGERGCCASG